LDIDDHLDDYLDWSITEGGLLPGTSMPSFVGVLAEDTIWRVLITRIPQFANRIAAGHRLSSVNP
jgi:hypothetical protein